MQITPPSSLIPSQCDLGENPLWHPTEKKLYWLDIVQGRIERFDPLTGIREEVLKTNLFGGFTFQKGGGLFLLMEKGVGTVWKNGHFTPVCGPILAEMEHRFNDAIVDPHGRVFSGTIGTEAKQGGLYRIDPEGSIHLLRKEVLCSNGMGFNHDYTRFFHTDSLKRVIRAYDYDLLTGTISNEVPLIQFTEKEGYPDGMTIDREDCLWVAFWDHFSIARFSPEGKRLLTIPIPVKRPTSLTFGGPNLSDLFITSAKEEKEDFQHELSGNIFHLKTEFQGKNPHFSEIATQSNSLSR